jgi:hypothetical protein
MLWLIETLVSMLWLVCLIKYGALTPSLPLAQRMQNILFTFVLTVGSIGLLDLLFWGILHPQRIPQHYFKQIGTFSPWLAFLAWLGSGLSGVVALGNGFAIVQRKASGRSVIWWIPFLAVFAVVEMLRGFQMRRDFRSAEEEFGFLVLFMLIAGCFYGWMFFFYKSKSMNDYFSVPKSADPPDSGLPAGVSD